MDVKNTNQGENWKKIQASPADPLTFFGVGPPSDQRVRNLKISNTCSFLINKDIFNPQSLPESLESHGLIGQKINESGGL